MLNPLITMPGGAEWLIILAIVILVFGAAKLPELARGTGQALRIFKSETKGLRDDDSDSDSDTATSSGSTTSTAKELPPTSAEEPSVEQDRQSDKHQG